MTAVWQRFFRAILLLLRRCALRGYGTIISAVAAIVGSSSTQHRKKVAIFRVGGDDTGCCHRAAQTILVGDIVRIGEDCEGAIFQVRRQIVGINLHTNMVPSGRTVRPCSSPC